jgi:hypothetical protein
MFKKQSPHKPMRALVPPALLPEFDQAEKLWAKGHPDQAIPIYIKLAIKAKALGSPLPAGNLYAEAASACLDAGDLEKGLDLARRAMGIFNENGILKKALAFKSQFSMELRGHGHQDLAAAFEREAGQMMPIQIDTDVKIERGHLPAYCPQCGAPVRLDRVEWLDLYSAVCNFCSATIKTVD